MWRTRRKRWRVAEVVERQPGLRLAPLPTDHLVLTGEVTFRLKGPEGPPIQDAFQVEIRVPATFPRDLPTVRELDPRRIQQDFHQFSNGDFCLASPTGMRLKLEFAPTLPTLVDEFVVPYLFGFAYFERFGKMPFGELDHGDAGLRQDFADLFRVPVETVDGFIRVAAMKKGVANKQPCPCGGGRRLGKCHHRRVTQLRQQLGRSWFATHEDLS